MNIRTIANVSLCLAMLSMSSGALAQSESRWQNVNINQQNREPRRANFFAFENLEKAQSFDKKKSANYLSMEGMWKFNFVKDHNKRPANFFALKYDDSQWKDFPVPGLFELNGYGDATYKNIGYAWATQFDPNPPYISELNNYTGSYRRTFELPKDWKGKDVYFHVGSATSNLTLWVNGKYVGYSEDSKVAAEFDITPYLEKGKQNLIAFTNDFLTGLTKQVIHQILEFCLGVRHLGGTKLTVRTTGGKALDDAVTDIYLIIQITPLQLIKLPIQFCLNILIRHLFEKFRMNQRTVKTTDYIKVYLGSIFRREDKMYTGSRTVTQRSTFQSRQAIHRSVQDSALADTIHSAQNIDIRTQFP